MGILKECLLNIEFYQIKNFFSKKHFFYKLFVLFSNIIYMIIFILRDTYKEVSKEKNVEVDRQCTLGEYTVFNQITKKYYDVFDYEFREDFNDFVDQNQHLLHISDLYYIVIFSGDEYVMSVFQSFLNDRGLTLIPNRYRSG